MAASRATLLCVANFPANTGYAWDFIERLYARIADHVAEHGIATIVAYPVVSTPLRTLAGSAARAVRLDASLQTRKSVQAVTELIRREDVRVVYFTDRSAWCLAYLRLRWAGARRIIVHDHSSGERTRPRGLKRAAKWLLVRTPGLVADVIVAVSDYVARRQVEVGLIPSERVVRVWNGLPVTPATESSDRHVHAIFGLAADRPLVVCACRATAEKGVAYLLRAFDRVRECIGMSGLRPALIYIGDGPQLAELRSLRETLQAREDIIFTGYRADAAEILSEADVCVVPSLWQDAFPLSVLEGMARGKPVIATRVGGIPEMIEHDEVGLLVPPADEVALAEAIAALLADPARVARLGENARRRVAERFTPEAQLDRLTALVEEGFGSACGALGSPSPGATSFGATHS